MSRPKSGVNRSWPTAQIHAFALMCEARFSHHESAVKIARVRTVRCQRHHLFALANRQFAKVYEPDRYPCSVISKPPVLCHCNGQMQTAGAFHLGLHQKCPSESAVPSRHADSAANIMFAARGACRRPRYVISLHSGGEHIRC